MNFRIAAIFASALLLSLFWNANTQAAPFPTNFDLDSLHKAEKQLDKYNGHTVAFRGQVTVIKQLADGKPYFFVQFFKPNAANEGVWVVSYIDEKPGDIKVGHNIAVLGYFAKVLPEEKEISAIHKAPYHAIGLCIANASTQMGLYAKDGTSRCADWQRGIIDDSISDSLKVRLARPATKKK